MYISELSLFFLFWFSLGNKVCCVIDSGLVMSLVDTKSWGGGSAMYADSQSSNDSSGTLHSTQSVTPPAPSTRRNMGGRRPIKDKNVSSRNL